MAVYSACEFTLLNKTKPLWYFSSAGFPNVTMAPDSSQGPIVINQDPVTQAILSESVMEPQVISSAYSQNAHAEIKFVLIYALW